MGAPHIIDMLSKRLSLAVMVKIDFADTLETMAHVGSHTQGPEFL